MLPRRHHQAGLHQACLLYTSGRFIEELGTDNPLVSPSEFKVDAEKVQAWIRNGAQPTDTVKALLKNNGVL